MTAPSRIPDLLKRVMANPHFDPAGHHIGRAQMILGLFYKVKKSCRCESKGEIFSSPIVVALSVDGPGREYLKPTVAAFPGMPRP